MEKPALWSQKQRPPHSGGRDTAWSRGVRGGWSEGRACPLLSGGQRPGPWPVRVGRASGATWPGHAQCCSGHTCGPRAQAPGMLRVPHAPALSHAPACAGAPAAAAVCGLRGPGPPPVGPSAGPGPGSRGPATLPPAGSGAQQTAAEARWGQRPGATVRVGGGRAGVHAAPHAGSPWAPLLHPCALPRRARGGPVPSALPGPLHPGHPCC